MHSIARQKSTPFCGLFQRVTAESREDRATLWSLMVQRRLSLVSRTPTLCAGNEMTKTGFCVTLMTDAGSRAFQ